MAGGFVGEAECSAGWEIRGGGLSGEGVVVAVEGESGYLKCVVGIEGCGDSHAIAEDEVGSQTWVSGGVGGGCCCYLYG